MPINEIYDNLRNFLREFETAMQTLQTQHKTKWSSCAKGIPNSIRASSAR